MTIPQGKILLVVLATLLLSLTEKCVAQEPSLRLLETTLMSVDSDIASSDWVKPIASAGKISQVSYAHQHGNAFQSSSPILESNDHLNEHGQFGFLSPSTFKDIEIDKSSKQSKMLSFDLLMMRRVSKFESLYDTSPGNFGFRFAAEKLDQNRGDIGTEFVLQYISGQAGGFGHLNEPTDGSLADIQLNRVFHGRVDGLITERKFGLRAIGIRNQRSNTSFYPEYDANRLLGINGALNARWNRNDYFFGAGVGAGLFWNFVSKGVAEDDRVAFSVDCDLVAGVHLSESTTFECGMQGIGVTGIVDDNLAYAGIRLNLAHRF